MDGIPTGPDLEAERKRLGLTTSEVARKAGLTDHSHLRKIEREEIDPRGETLRRIVEALEAEERDDNPA